MAIVTGNSVLRGMRGMVGDQLVFKRYGDKTVVTAKPDVRKKNSPLQALNLERFREAARYARAILRDPVKAEKYRKLAVKLKKHSAYNVAISEYMLRIRIQSKDAVSPVSEDKKRVVVTATKGNFKVSSVGVKVTDRAGWVVAAGAASAINATDWVYKLPVPLAAGFTFIVTATDTLGLSTTRYLWP